ncbi:hypothetical protein ACI2KR_31670 [Pseudomonas luteola]
MKYLTPETTVKMRSALKELDGVAALAGSIENKALSESILSKIEASKQAYLAQYAEIENEDGTVLVKHPGIGFITVTEAPCAEPTRLFASRVKSLSSVKINVYHADALVHEDGNVTYVNRRLVVATEMTQSSFADLITSPGRGHRPATIRELNGKSIAYEGDINTIRSKLMLDEALGVTNGLSAWVDELLSGATQACEKGGVMSKKAREEIAHNASVLNSWGESNPGYYAKLLGEFTALTTADMKLEVMSAHRLKGDE